MKKRFFVGLILFICFEVCSQGKLIIASAHVTKNMHAYFAAADSEVVLMDFRQIPLADRDSLFSLCQGLLLTGGSDIGPKAYGKDSLRRYCEVTPTRDSLERWLFKKASSQHLPVLGICRGMQHLNVLLGGTLYVDLPTFFEKKSIVHRDPALKSDVYHPISVSSVFLAGLLERNELTVNSYHHQGVEMLAPYVEVGATSPDGLPEAIHWLDVPHRKWMLGVQWHPERMYTKYPEQLALATIFIRQCQFFSAASIEQ
jgi:putative glutamine amidotransferase